MNNFLFSLNATVPIFLMIALGYGLRRLGVITAEFASVGDKLTFRVTLPVMLFLEISKANIHDTFDGAFFGFCIGITCLAFGLIYLLSRLLIRDRAMVGTYAMVSFRGSAAVLGIAFVEEIYGSVGFAPLMIVAAVPFYNIFSVLALAFSAPKEDSVKVSMKHVLKEILTNPLIISVVLAIPANLIHWTEWRASAIPLDFLGKVGGIATPFALLTLGAGFEHKETLTRWKPVLTASLTKLVLLPAVGVPLAVLLGFRNAQLLAIAIMLASPTTVACYIMARNMKSDSVLASGVVMVTTLFSSVTITVLVFLLKMTGCI